MWADEKSDISFGDIAKIDIIYPEEKIVFSDWDNVNNSSIAFRLEMEGKSALFMGDIEKEAEEEILKKLEVDEELSSSILKLGHHGSKTSSTYGFLEAVNPELVVISAGKGNKYNHPHEEVLDRIKRVGVDRIMRTDEEGTIELHW